MKKFLLFLVLVLAIVLRIFHFGNNPPSLYWDEASLGYNAYLISSTGYDEHGEFLPLARFIAFGDYKPPGYIYAAVPSVWLFGLNEFSVRLPSMIAGILMVLLAFFLVKELFGNIKLAILVSFLLAVSPWSLHFSRAAFEAHLAAFFNLAGIYFFILSIRKKKLIVFSVVFFVLSFYTFNANRIIAPLLLLGLSVIYIKHIYNNKWNLLAILISILFLLPSVTYLQSSESRLRFQEVSIFNNLDPIIASNNMIATDGNSWWAKIIHNRRVLFTKDYLKHYFDNFSGRFLFTHGDVNPRLSVQGMGQLYYVELPFLLIGGYLLIKRRRRSTALILLWMAVAVIPAGTARETPHALRIASILPTYQIIIAFGVYQFVIFLKNKLKGYRFHFLLIVSCFLFLVNIFYYLHIYHVHFPRVWSGEWQYGYKQMVNYVLEREQMYDNIIVTDALGRPYIYFAFYKPFKLNDLLSQKRAFRDWYGFWTVSSIGKISFDLKILTTATGRVLLVSNNQDMPTGFKVIKEIYNLSFDTVFYIGEKS